MKTEEIKKQLLKEIELLKNKRYGFINAGTPNYNRLFEIITFLKALIRIKL